ncbi:replication protein A 70 kDa DNA-binding subunit E [Pyrus ussuriensis x Pyrus communis]|uniref:Replication protein A 70 kDa DNA-binding subunit E n=1 Tax=Pyrus ussuriensis x Pyrus communis TaxID=2448454 RepID=A0A5N5HJ95_9ROSA|nr:replication protein A 70 kDa DNA-binding subunit E [Pyrus ussuriensis x Pyrus communis]
MCDSGIFPVLVVKGGRVNDFNGKVMGTISTSQLLIEPNIEKAYEVRNWFEKEGKNTLCISISKETADVGRTDIRKTVSQIKDEKLRTSKKPDWITVGATISVMENISSSASKRDNVMPTRMNVARFGNATSRHPTTAGNVGYSNNAGREFGAPENQASHNGNQYDSKFLSIGSASSYQTCNCCEDTGHSSMNCPSVKHGPRQSLGVGYSSKASSRLATETFRGVNRAWKYLRSLLVY